MLDKFEDYVHTHYILYGKLASKMNNIFARIIGIFVLEEAKLSK